MSHVTFQTVFLQGNVELDTLPSLFTLGPMEPLQHVQWRRSIESLHVHCNSIP